MSDLIGNEQTKLLSNAIDRASTACITVGIATPLAGAVYGIGNFGSLSVLRLMGTIVGWLLLGFFLHYMARRNLRSLRP